MRAALSAPIFALLFGALLAFPLVSACGDDDPSSCTSINTTICEKACACGTECTFGDANFSIGFDSVADCQGLLNFGCGGGGGYATPDECVSALATAQCVDRGDGVNTLDVPTPACDMLEE